MATIESFPVVIEIPVAWGDMDAFGHVNNVVYFRYFESARIAYFEQIDYLALMERTGVGPILAATSCRFRAPLTYPDTVRAGARIRDLQADRFRMDYLLVSRELDVVAAEGEGRVVSFDYRRNCKVPLPGELAERIRRIENDAA